MITRMIIITMDIRAKLLSKKTFKIILYFFILLAVLLVLTLQYLLFDIKKNVIADKHQESISQVSVVKGPQIIKPFNLLVIGIDDGLGRNWRGRTDTIIVARFSPRDKKVNVLSIPRDTLSLIPGYGADKINHAFAFGGTDLSIQAIEKLINNKIDYYLLLNMDGFINIVNKIGGIDFELDRDISRKDMGIYLKKGKQHLNGQQALAVARFRYEPMGDIARVKRQIRLLKEVMNQSMTKKISTNNLFLIKDLEDNIQTDLSLKDIGAIFNTFKNANKNNVTTEVVPGTFYNYKKISYWKPDIKKLNIISKNLF